MVILYVFYKIICSIILIFVALYLFYKFYFLRNPKRIIPNTEHILSPADGRIIKIIDLDKSGVMIKKKWYSGIKTLCSDISRKCYVIVISMSIFDVHYQRSPVDGIVKGINYRTGKFRNAVYGGAQLVALENEKNEIILENKKIRLKVLQVAGILARRIRCFVHRSQKVFKGQLIGLICLGSQVVLILPKDKVVLKIEEKQKVKAGETVIAEIKRKNQR